MKYKKYKSSRRLLSLLIIICIGTLTISAQRVTKEEALTKAERFFKKAATRRAAQKSPTLVLANNRDEFYVFNDEANGGYVVVSGEKRMPEVLAYSDKGTFHADDMPCNMKAWLDTYAEQVNYLRAHPEAKAAGRTPSERENISPLLTCWFSQGSPYNNKCPEVDGKRCVTGCVATAMAQIMYYHQWPKQTSSIIPGYTTWPLKIEMPDIPITTIDWDNMLGNYKGNINRYSEAQIDAVSTLMLLCGTAVQMGYQPSSSGGITPTKIFSKYFDYNDLAEDVYRSAYSSDEWEQLIYEELKNKRPVYYGGYGKSGHAFVLDGYENGYFHVNWGWGGEESNVQMTSTEGWKGFTDSQSAIIGIQPALPNSRNRYAVLDNGNMTLYYDENMDSRSGTVLKNHLDWANYAEQITICVIDPSFVDLKPRNLFGFFSGFKNLKTIDGMENLNTSEVINMGELFYNCSSLTYLDVSGFKTDKVTGMEGMFSNCSSLTNLDVSGFKTDKVERMGNMFYNCSSLTNLDVSSFKTDNVTDMRNMFCDCSSLTSLDVSHFNTENVETMGGMFTGLRNLTSLNLSNFKTDKITDLGWMFHNCSSLTSLDVSSFKTDNVTDMRNMFCDCSSLTSLDVSGFNTENVTNMRSMFENCFSLINLDVSGFKTDKVTDMSEMFYNCSSLTSLDVSRFNTENVEKMRGMFSGLRNFTSLDLSNFKTDKVADMEWMFSNCSSLTNLNLSRFKTDNVTFMGGMFYGCSSLTNVDLSSFKTNSVTSIYKMFEGCSALTSLDLSNFMTDNIKNWSNMFASCSKLTTIYVSDLWNMTNAQKTEKMFLDCTSIIGGAGTTYDLNHIDGLYARIDGGSSSPGYLTYKAPTGVKTIYRQISAKESVYSINGLKLRKEDMRKGLYIVNGRKILKK